MIPTPNPSYFKLNDYLIFMDNTANKNAAFYTRNTLIYFGFTEVTWLSQLPGRDNTTSTYSCVNSDVTKIPLSVSKAYFKTA